MGQTCLPLTSVCCLENLLCENRGCLLGFWCRNRCIKVFCLRCGHAQSVAVVSDGPSEYVCFESGWYEACAERHGAVLRCMCTMCVLGRHLCNSTWGDFS